MADDTDPNASNTADSSTPPATGADSSTDTSTDGSPGSSAASPSSDGASSPGSSGASDESSGSPSSANNPPSGGGGTSSPPLSTALNPQIVQAVGTTNHAVLNGAGPGANGIAYQKVAQAAAYAVQDSTDYMRNIMSMASATTGVALQKMLVEKKTDPYADIIKAATQAVTDAQQTFTSVGTASSSVVKDFDSMA
ncbi:hypothetical protein [Thalassospira xiamenensis]|uniref:Uncharacterized protein n=1 Tax=Thalassospira xiamenensis TaxID=220697 RepID=A0A285TN43_9PROT|nr:hypothetical protein [Thalassospira xiamenensis]SOC24001.1 hypothetical protein SAMN05428964_104235 [Thalassospira xiamenensis]